MQPGDTLWLIKFHITRPRDTLWYVVRRTCENSKFKCITCFIIGHLCFHLTMQNEPFRQGPWKKWHACSILAFQHTEYYWFYRYHHLQRDVLSSVPWPWHYQQNLFSWTECAFYAMTIRTSGLPTMHVFISSDVLGLDEMLVRDSGFFSVMAHGQPVASMRFDPTAPDLLLITMCMCWSHVTPGQHREISRKARSSSLSLTFPGEPRTQSLGEQPEQKMLSPSQIKDR